MAKFNQKKADEILKSMRAGASFISACSIVGVSPFEADDWRVAGYEEGKGKKWEFDQNVIKTESAHKAKIERAAQKLAEDGDLNAIKFKQENKNRLSIRRQKFIQFFCGESNGNGTDAAKKAGYSNPSVAASRLLNDNQIKFEIRKYRTLLRGEAVANSEEILEELTAIIRREYECDGSREVIRACETIAKMLGLEAPKKHEINSTNVVFQMPYDKRREGLDG